MPGPVTVFQATIPSGATGLSNEIDVNGYQIVGVQMPADWVAADLTFKGRPPGSNASNPVLQNVYDSSDAEVVVQAAEDRYITFTAAIMDSFVGLSRIQVRSGTSGTPVDQTASRVLSLIAIPIT